jgi:hypothetical protein
MITAFLNKLLTTSNQSKESAQQLITLGLFNKLFCFLLGTPGQKEDLNARRWTSSQLKEFGLPLFELISSLVLKCNILSLKTCGKSLNIYSHKKIKLIFVNQNK